MSAFVYGQPVTVRLDGQDEPAVFCQDYGADTCLVALDRTGEHRLVACACVRPGTVGCRRQDDERG
jgi:hypothetical protein